MLTLPLASQGDAELVTPDPFLWVMSFRFLNVHLLPATLRTSCLVQLTEARFSNRCTIVLGHSTKSYFCQSKMAEPKVLQFVLLFPRGQ